MKERIATLSKSLIDAAPVRNGIRMVTFGGVRVPDIVKNIAFAVRAASPQSTAFIGATVDLAGKPLLTVMLTNDLVEEGHNASAMVREAAKAIKRRRWRPARLRTSRRQDAEGISAAADILTSILLK